LTTEEIAMPPFCTRSHRIWRHARWGVPIVTLVAALPTLILWHDTALFALRPLLYVALVFFFGLASGVDICHAAWREESLEREGARHRQAARSNAFAPPGDPGDSYDCNN
jgi:hypothetical protein